MSTTTTPEEVIGKVNEIATMAGYTLQPHPQLRDMLICNFDMGNGRSQKVYITPLGKMPDGSDVVSFMSPCQAIKKGLLKGMGKKQAIDLLQRNSRIACGSFAVESMGDEMDVLVVRSTQIVDTMEVEEFKLHCSAVGVLADEYEREHGQDMF